MAKPFLITEHKLVIATAAKGGSIADVAQLLGRSRRTICAHAARNAIKFHGKRGRPSLEQQMDRQQERA